RGRERGDVTSPEQWWLPRWSVIVVLTESYGGFRRVAGVYGGSPGSGGFCGGVSGERRGRRVCLPEKTRERRKGRGMRRLRLREGKNEVNVRVLG
ncbi:hypothetical protein HAX54_013505, partial [Datura stramonium]|nr:hypothetical protein [Datura stramonium]